MRKVLAITWLTWKAAFRFRFFWVLLALLVASVVLLPLMIRDDGTARGFTQILLTYTLSLVTAILGAATLWLACGTLARDIEQCQMQVVAVKPVSRWQIWSGKWLGLVTLDAALLALAGVCIMALLQYRARNLPEDQRTILRNEVLVARGSIREAPVDIEAELKTRVETLLREAEGKVDVARVRELELERLRARYQVVPPNNLRRWNLELGVRRFTLKDQPLFVRVKFYAAETNATGTYLGLWQVGPVDAADRYSFSQSLAANTFHEFQIPPNRFDGQGRLTIDFINRNPCALLFPLEDGLEVLYREGGFGLNLARGLWIVLCWLALLASLGLAAASLLSFPVAAFTTASLLVVVFSSGTLAGAVESGTITMVNEETGQAGRSILDAVMIPLFKAILSVVGLARAFSPIDALSSGRSIPWSDAGLAFAQIVLLMGGVLAAAGIWVFNRRELAAAQTGG